MSTQTQLPTTSTMVLLTRLTKQAMRRTNPEDLGLDVRLLMALSFVADHDGAPQQELADALCMDPKNVVLVLNELEAAGHLVRRRDTDDRRRHRVYMTDDGRHTLERATRGFEAVEDEVLQALSPEEREALRELVIRALRGSEPAAACAADTARQTI